MSDSNLRFYPYRAFLAVPLPEALREELGRLQKALRHSGVAWRYADPQHIHLTLLFLGDIDRATEGAMTTTMDELASPDFSLPYPVEGLGAFPDLVEKPRVLWAGIGGNWAPLRHLHKTLADAARGAGLEVEKQPYHPHLTLARIPKGFHGPLRLPEKLKGGFYGYLPIEKLVLFESRLSPAGPSYRAVHERVLTGS
ncbi:RNA 2',3'-cyclic phosphodiesterase [bacterium]|nr:RNA 2',3'-cyclic phosphodiesterase [bacterium]